MPTTFTTGQSAQISVTMQNAGGTTWTRDDGYKLGSLNPQDNMNWGLNRVELPGDVRPGELATFKFSLIAPTTPQTTDVQWRMVQESVSWFGQVATQTVVIARSPVCSDLANQILGLQGQIVDDEQELKQIDFTQPGARQEAHALTTEIAVSLPSEN